MVPGTAARATEARATDSAERPEPAVSAGGLKHYFNARYFRAIRTATYMPKKRYIPKKRYMPFLSCCMHPFKTCGSSMLSTPLVVGCSLRRHTGDNRDSTHIHHPRERQKQRRKERKRVVMLGLFVVLPKLHTLVHTYA